LRFVVAASADRARIDGTRDANHPSVGRKLSMLATIMVVPGGLVLLVAIALAIALMRTPRGRRLLVPLRRRVPPRLRAHAKRILAIARGEEKLFLPAATSVRSS
jgi:hypothetical protein